MRRRVLIILMTILCLSGTSLCLEVNQQYIIETGNEDAIAAYKDGQFTIVDNWQINGWLRVIAPPRYEYFDNLSNEFQALYLYSYYLKLNKLYFQSLVGKEVDKLFFNEEVLKTVKMLPVYKEDFQAFAAAALERDPALLGLTGEYMVVAQRAEMQAIFDRYELHLMPDAWRDYFIHTIAEKAGAREVVKLFSVTGFVALGVSAALLLVFFLLVNLGIL